MENLTQDPALGRKLGPWRAPLHRQLSRFSLSPVRYADLDLGIWREGLVWPSHGALPLKVNE